MKKQLAILLAGVMVIIPFAITLYVVVSVGMWLNGLGETLLRNWWQDLQLPFGVGVVVVLLLIYLVGLMTRLWVFRWTLDVLDRLVSTVPGAKTIYESVRDLLRLFGPESRRMGRAVIYRPPGTEMAVMGILTNEAPVGIPQAPKRMVAIYIPCAYMFGGAVIYVPAEHVQDANIPVEEALKVSAIAQVGAKIVAGPGRPALVRGAPSPGSPPSPPANAQTSPSDPDQTLP